SQAGQIKLAKNGDGPPDSPDKPKQLFFERILFSPSVDTETAKAIFDAETEAICERRRQQEDAPLADLAGLALSGGGLRSATFALGALQGLAKNDVLCHFDYLPTVSGGGYAGSFLSS